MKKSLSIHIGGKVQGVFFRASAKKIADELGIKGIIRNEPDGGVYVEAEAEEVVLSRFIDWCRHGPVHASVMTFVIAEQHERAYVDFRIVR